MFSRHARMTFRLRIRGELGETFFPIRDRPELKDTILDNEQIEIDLIMALWARCC